MDGRNLIIAGPSTHRNTFARCLLRTQHSREKVVQEVPGTYGRQFPNTTGELAYQQRYPVRPLFVNKEGLVGDVVVSGHLGHNDHENLVLSIRGEIRRGTSRTSTLELQQAYCGLLGHRLTEPFGSQF